MQLKKVILATLGAAALGVMAVGCSSDEPNIATIEQQFRDVPDDATIAVYWYWLNDNLSAEGVVKDLQSMKQAGIGRAYIGFQGIENLPVGDVKFQTDEWWNVVRTALRTASELGIEIGIFNCPGWSQSGGPWVEPSQAMRYLTSAQTVVTGDGATELVFEQPTKDVDSFDYVTTLAWPAPEREPWQATYSVKMDSQKASQLRMELDTAVTVRSVAVKVNTPTRAQATLSARIDGVWTPVKTFWIDRYNDHKYVGFDPYAPIVLALDEQPADAYCLDMCGKGDGEAVVTLSEQPMVERYAEKTLAKMFQEPLPLWGQYMWPAQAESTDNTWTVDPAKVVNLSALVDSTGMIHWTAPEGRWIVANIGMTPTGVTNSPAMPDAKGLEVDKMNKAHLEKHFDAFIGEILRRIPAEERTSFKVVVEDSYETGGQNWTDGLTEKFEQRYGYSPLPYLPTLQGVTVGNRDMSDRFLWDLRRLVADMVAYEYVGGLKEISNRHGLTTWLENYGHWGFPSEFLMYGGQSDEIGGEFWSEGSLGDIENRAASSCGHIYGKKKIWAESCTSGGPVYTRYPAMMKQRVDRFFTEGINATLLHLYIHQSADSAEPGLAAWFGNEFNRKNTWFTELHQFTDYLKRCNYVLQQGRYIADVAYFIGEDAPKMTGSQDPELPAGYSFDYINGEILRDHAHVNSEGRLVLDSGMEYRLLVLPRQTTIRPELLEKIKGFVEKGLAVLGPRPETSPSLQGWPEADNRVSALAEEMWPAKADGTAAKRRVGRGWVFTDCSIEYVADAINMHPDMSVPTDEPMPLFIHRSLRDAQIYFVANPGDSVINITPTFAVDTKLVPQVWNPVNGEVRTLTDYQVTPDGSGLTVPLQLDAIESTFVVFRSDIKAPEALGKPNYPEAVLQTPINGPWTLAFDASRRGPAEPIVLDSLVSWTELPDDAARYYAGTAVYTTTFNLPELPAEGTTTYLDLGKVRVMGSVKVNGQEAGGVWTKPYRVNVTELLQPGDNTVEISVVNNWKNRLIGDSLLPEDERINVSNVFPWGPGEPLQRSGLLGPVSLDTFEY